MVVARLFKHELKFVTPGQTSRGTLYSKPSWFIILQKNNSVGIGECSVIPGLNPEYDNSYENYLQSLIASINSTGIPADLSSLNEYPSIQFGLETALINLKHNQPGVLFPGDFSLGKKGIGINGLIWMGTKEKMQQQIQEKIDLGYTVLKLKIGSLDFGEEVSLLQQIRKHFSPADLELRLDANGAFTPKEAEEKLKILSRLHIHSVEQPIKSKQWEAMAHLCANSPIAVALDEELIGVYNSSEMEQMLSFIKPQYIILKPSLLGGFKKSTEWIDLARKYHAGWWITSALESNVGLNAIAQWTFMLKPDRVQGLGTGQVFTNNISSPLYLKKARLFYNSQLAWEFPFPTSL